MVTRLRFLCAALLLGPLCLLTIAAPLRAAEPLSGVQVDADPFLLTTDVGDSAAEEQKYAEKLIKNMLRTKDYFMQVYNLKDTCFQDYANFYNANKWESRIRVNVWKNFAPFLADLQKRYKTKSILSAFKGFVEETDDYGKPTGVIIREIGVSAEGMDDTAVLRDIYHEMGHIFMATYMVYPVEVPSWIEEGTAQLFQFYKGNGTNPERERDQREGWLTEMVNEDYTIPWKDIIKVSNMDNLDFTYQDPLRGDVQYIQSWSMIEFMISNDLRMDAYVQMLQLFKSKASAHWDETGHSNAAMQNYLYTIQEDAFQQCYGNNFLEVEATWKKWITRQYQIDLRKKPWLHYHRGEWYLVRANYPRKDETKDELLDKADVIFQACIKDQPLRPEGYVGRGRVQLERHKLAEAGESFAKAISLGADNYDALLYGGALMIMNGHCDTAIAPLKKAALQRPGDWQAHFYLGQAMAAGGGDLTEAVVHLRTAAEKSPKDAAKCGWLEGTADYLSGKMHEAYIAYLKVENLDPHFDNIKIYQSLAIAEDNDHDQAVALLQPIADTVIGKAFLDSLNDLKKPIPKITFSPNGLPQLDIAAVGLIAVAPPIATPDGTTTGAGTATGGDAQEPSDPKKTEPHKTAFPSDDGK